ncbi:MAG: DUF262 domain-containing protein [Deltaproteobacteria bacterium]|nr:DUF262 domain-containing protein [Deltaproteobacteria bacterium]
MKADTINLQQAFQGWCRLEVPLYQRPYVWRQTQQWEPLWTDVLAAVNRREGAESAAANGGGGFSVPHFVGAVVLQHIPSTLGSIQTRLVIDGQQRLTTLQILLEALADHARLDDHATAQALQMLTRNPESLASNSDMVFKVWPTNVDRDTFRKVMHATSADELLTSISKPSHTEDMGHQIGNCYLYFFRAVHRWLEEDPGQRAARMRRMFDTLAQDIQLVTIELQGADDPQLIFETLNARGTPLLPADLIKNHLFGKLKWPEAETNSLYDATWGEFDRARHYWREVVGRGHAQRPRIDLFMQFYLSAHTKAEVQVQHLYATFKQDGDLAKEPVDAVLRRIRRHADLFRSFDKLACKQPPSRASLFFRRLEAMDLWTVYPFLLALLSKHDVDDPCTQATLEDIESFLVRRLVCRLNTRGYGRFFLDLISCVDNDPQVTHDRVRSHLLKSEAAVGRWPVDDEFKREWLGDPIYENQLRAKVRMVLEALEHAKMSPLSPGYWVGKQPTIEHLLPVEWAKHWPLPDGQDAEAERHRNRVLHTIGNLTLLSAPLNSLASNSAWSTKRTEIGKHAMFQMNVDLMQAMDWNEDQIRARGEQLFECARQIWPRPDLALC